MEESSEVNRAAAITATISDICEALTAMFVVVYSLSRIQLIAAPWIVACQVLLSKEFFRQEYCSGLSCPPPEDLPNPGIERVSPALAGRLFTTEPPGKPLQGWGQQSFLRTPSGSYDRIHGLVYPVN